MMRKMTTKNACAWAEEEDASCPRVPAEEVMRDVLGLPSLVWRGWSAACVWHLGSILH